MVVVGHFRSNCLEQYRLLRVVRWEFWDGRTGKRWFAKAGFGDVFAPVELDRKDREIWQKEGTVQTTATAQDLFSYKKVGVCPFPTPSDVTCHWSEMGEKRIVSSLSD